jgi:hypothetical protein
MPLTEVENVWALLKTDVPLPFVPCQYQFIPLGGVARVSFLGPHTLVEIAGASGGFAKSVTFSGTKLLSAPFEGLYLET